MVEINSKAPDFKLKGTDGRMHSLSGFRGKYLVLYFYPKDDTMGCTAEAKGFSNKLNEIRKLGAEVVGVSSDSLDSHNGFCKKYGLKSLLLSDPGRRAIRRYEAYGNKGIFGWGTLRKTYIIDGKGIVVKIYERVHPIKHEDEVIDFLRHAA